MATRPCPSCGQHGRQCGCVQRAAAPKRKPASPPDQTPAAKRSASAASGVAAAGASAGGGSSTAKSSTVKGGDAQRLILFNEVADEFERRHRLKLTLPVHMKKFEAPDGLGFELDMATMSDEDVKQLVRHYRCNMFRVKCTGKLSAKHKTMPYTVEFAEGGGGAYCFEGYQTTTLYSDQIRPYCLVCGGGTSVFRKRGTEQTFKCAGCKIELTRKVAANAFARLGATKALAEGKGLTYAEYLRSCVSQCKRKFTYAAPAAASAAAPAPAPAAAAAAAPATPAPVARPWRWSTEDVPGGRRIEDVTILAPQLVAIIQSIVCAGKGTSEERKCVFHFKGGGTRLRLQKQSLQLFQPNLDVTERLMFHGCPFEVLPQILMNGFQNAGTTNAKAYGQGVYFAADPRYSLQRRYSPSDKDDNRVLLICAGIAGKQQDTNGSTTMLSADCRTGGNRSQGIYMKPFANLADVAIMYAVVWQEKK